MGLDSGQFPLQGQNKGQQIGGLTIPWTEFISRNSWAGDGSFRAGDSRVTMHIIIHWENLLVAIQQILGYAWKPQDQGANSRKMSRALPFRHPLFTWCWASAITSIRGIHFTGKNTGGGNGPYADYQYCMLTVLFETPPYEILADDQIPVDTVENAAGTEFEIRREWRRYTERHIEITSEALTVERGYLVWTDHSDATKRTSPNNKVHKSKSAFLTKVNIRLIWHQVPDVGLFSGGGFDNDGTPDNILEVVNTLNDDLFMGWDMETLLCFPPRFMPFTMPVPPHIINLLPTQVPRAWTVEFNLVYFAPTPLGEGGLTTLTSGGWNKAPDSTGIWWPIAYEGNPTRSLYDTSEFGLMFAMNN